MYVPRTCVVCLSLVPEKHEYLGVDDGQDDEGHDILHDEYDDGEAVLVDVAGELLGADLYYQDVRVRNVHPVHRLVQEQG